jgi:hypothetical protein
MSKIQEPIRPNQTSSMKLPKEILFKKCSTKSQAKESQLT